MKENRMMTKGMVKEHTLSLMEKSMWGNGMMTKGMVKEHTLTLVEVGM